MSHLDAIAAQLVAPEHGTFQTVSLEHQVHQTGKSRRLLVEMEHLATQRAVRACGPGARSGTEGQVHRPARHLRVTIEVRASALDLHGVFPSGPPSGAPDP